MSNHNQGQQNQPVKNPAENPSERQAQKPGEKPEGQYGKTGGQNEQPPTRAAQ